MRFTSREVKTRTRLSRRIAVSLGVDRVPRLGGFVMLPLRIGREGVAGRRVPVGVPRLPVLASGRADSVETVAPFSSGAGGDFLHGVPRFWILLVERGPFGFPAVYPLGIARRSFLLLPFEILIVSPLSVPPFSR